MTEPRTHYQLSFTSRQALAFFVGCLAALGGAFFLGLMTGLSGRPSQSAATVSPTPASGAQVQPEETPEAASPPGLRGAGRVATSAPEPTAPATLEAFEDSGGGESATPSRKARVTPRAAGGEGVWVQVASLLSREEARALAARLSKRGHHTQIVVTTGRKGRLYRVRVGPYPSAQAAGAASGRIAKDAGVKRTWIAPEGK